MRCGFSKLGNSPTLRQRGRAGPLLGKLPSELSLAEALRMLLLCTSLAAPPMLPWYHGNAWIGAIAGLLRAFLLLAPVLRFLCVLKARAPLPPYAGELKVPGNGRPSDSRLYFLTYSLRVAFPPKSQT